MPTHSNTAWDLTATNLKIGPNVRSTAHHLICQNSAHLTSTIPLCQNLLEGGLPIGGITEWVDPSKFFPQDIFDSFLLNPENQANILWCHFNKESAYFRSTGRDRRQNLPRHATDWQVMRLSTENTPTLLKSLLGEPRFPIIVFEDPEHFTPLDFAFIASRARIHGIAVIVKRFGSDQRTQLSSPEKEACKKGDPTPFTQMRVTCHLAGNQIRIAMNVSGYQRQLALTR